MFSYRTTALCVLTSNLLTLPCRGFNTDTEALYGVGERGRNNRPEITAPVIRFLLFFNHRISSSEMSGFDYRKPSLGFRLRNRRPVSVPKSGNTITTIRNICKMPQKNDIEYFLVLIIVFKSFCCCGNDKRRIRPSFSECIFFPVKLQFC